MTTVSNTQVLNGLNIELELTQMAALQLIEHAGTIDQAAAQVAALQALIWRARGALAYALIAADRIKT